MNKLISVIPEKTTFNMFLSNSYLINCADKKVFIDPAHSPEDFPHEVREQVKIIIGTHGHFDHTCSSELWLQENPEITYYMHEADHELTSSETNGSLMFGLKQTGAKPTASLADQEQLNIDDNLYLEFVHTPGHTEGSVLILLKAQDTKELLALFTGDTIFVNSVGRTDLPGGSGQKLQASLYKIARLSLSENFQPELPVYFGHGAPATWAEVKQYNPYMAYALAAVQEA